MRKCQLVPRSLVQKLYHTLNATAASQEADARLREALTEMVRTQRDWEEAVGKIIGHPPNIFTRAIDRAEAALSHKGRE